MKLQIIAKYIIIQILLFGMLGIVYAVWNDTVSTEDILTATSDMYNNEDTGIGTTGLQTKLHVDGIIKISGVDDSTATRLDVRGNAIVSGGIKTTCIGDCF